ncbi:MAG: NAD(P)-dependent oxidoreductase [Burkholderiales bacterium]
MLTFARRSPQLMAAQRNRTWAPLIDTGLPRDLAGQTAVIVGWGPIGQRVGAMLRLLDINVIVIRSSTHSNAGERDAQPSVTFEAIHQVLPRADWLILACPLTERTRGLVNREALAAMPRTAHLINVARGEIVVEADLIDALSAQRLAGAFLDVFEHEPLATDSPLWSMPNVIATPHTAGHSDGHERRVADLFIENLGRWQRDQPLHNQVV